MMASSFAFLHFAMELNEKYDVMIWSVIVIVDGQSECRLIWMRMTLVDALTMILMLVHIHICCEIVYN